MPNQTTATGAVQSASDPSTAIQFADLFSAFADPTRIRIVIAVAEKEICVHELCAILDMTQSAISHQLRVLRDRRVVRFRKQGRHIYYRLDDEHIRELFKQAAEHLRHTNQSMPGK